MPTYNVYEKGAARTADNLFYSYNADQPVEWDGMSFAQYDHVESIQSNIVDVEIVRMSWTQTQWKRRFSQQERLDIREAAINNATLADFMDLMNSAEEISNDDPDTIAAVNMLEQVGLIAAGRAQEILYG